MATFCSWRLTLLVVWLCAVWAVYTAFVHVNWFHDSMHAPQGQPMTFHVPKRPNLRKMLGQRNKWVRAFTVREKAPPEPHVDVVVTWHCDNIDWLRDIDASLAPTVTVVLLHKVDESDLENPKCHPNSIPTTSVNVTYIRLPNQGRDVHSQFAYIVNAYSVLPTYVMFLQADHHWFIDDWLPKAHSFKTNAAAINDMVPMALRRKLPFIPVAPWVGGLDEGQPVLFVDRESNIDQEEQDKGDPPTLKKFMAGYHDMDNHAREILRVIFGGNACDYEHEVKYVPGFQYFVHRDRILSRPKAVWQGLEDMSLDCHVATYGIERVSIVLFNSSQVAVSPDEWQKPLICPSQEEVDNGPIRYFLDPPNPYLEREFWKRAWGCDPLSQFLKDREATNVMAKKARDILEGKTPPESALKKFSANNCSWTVAYNVWYGPGAGDLKVPDQDCLSKCCSDAECMGIVIHSDLRSQCYKHTSLPDDIKSGARSLTPLKDFFAGSSKPTEWSFFLKQAAQPDPVQAAGTLLGDW